MSIPRTEAVRNNQVSNERLITISGGRLDLPVPNNGGYLRGRHVRRGSDCCKTAIPLITFVLGGASLLTGFLSPKPYAYISMPLGGASALTGIINFIYLYVCRPKSAIEADIRDIEAQNQTLTEQNALLHNEVEQIRQLRSTIDIQIEKNRRDFSEDIKKEENTIDQIEELSLQLNSMKLAMHEGQAHVEKWKQAIDTFVKASDTFDLSSLQSALEKTREEIQSLPSTEDIADELAPFYTVEIMIQTILNTYKGTLARISELLEELKNTNATQNTTIDQTTEEIAQLNNSIHSLTLAQEDFKKAVEDYELLKTEYDKLAEKVQLLLSSQAPEKKTS